MEPLFDVCYAGELQDGQDLQSVRQKLQKLFNANPETLDKLFSGKTQTLRRNCDKATTLKYQQAITKAGAKPIIRAATNAKPTSSTPARSIPIPEAGMVLAPAGSDVLRPEERKAEVSSDIDTSSLDVVEIGVQLTHKAPVVDQAPDTSHLSMAEAGEDIPSLQNGQVQLDPDTSKIHLSPEGTDFSDCTRVPTTAPVLETSSIELAPAGADVLEQKYKKNEKTVAPDTSHLSLD